jgi:hypothetical protein
MLTFIWCHFEFSFKRTVLRANDLRNLRMAPQFADEEWKGWHIDTINPQRLVLFLCFGVKFEKSGCEM